MSMPLKWSEGLFAAFDVQQAENREYLRSIDGFTMYHLLNLSSAVELALPSEYVYRSRKMGRFSMSGMDPVPGSRLWFWKFPEGEGAQRLEIRIHLVREGDSTWFPPVFEVGVENPEAKVNFTMDVDWHGLPAFLEYLRGELG